MNIYFTIGFTKIKFKSNPDRKENPFLCDVRNNKKDWDDGGTDCDMIYKFVFRIKKRQPK